MLLDISEILRSVGSSYTFKLDEKDLPLNGLELTSPVVGQITVSNSGSRLVIRGEAWGDVVLQCGRCLQPFVFPVDAEIEEDFEMSLVQRLASRQKVDDETMQALFTGPAINLNELISQEFTLNLPINPACGADCHGACVRCGKNPCERPPEPEGRDPRWGPLLEQIGRKLE